MHSNLRKFLSPDCPEGMTQTEFAKALGITPGAVSNWVNGTRKPNRWLVDKVLRKLSAWHGRPIKESEIWPWSNQ